MSHRTTYRTLTQGTTHRTTQDLNRLGHSEFFIERLHEAGNQRTSAAPLSHDLQDQVFSERINQLRLFVS